MLKLYTHPMSRGRMARWMLEEVGESYEVEYLDYGTTMKAPAYLAINPMGKVPALVHDGCVVTECPAILTYLAETFPQAGLRGDDRAAFLRWMFFGAGPLEYAIVNRALGVDVDIMMILGLAISNGLIALAGALLAQYQGFADVQMGIGMMVWGLASVIIGEALVGSNKQGLVVAGTVIGSVLFRLLVAIALRWGLNPNDLKLITALFVFAALVGPTIGRSFVNKRGNQPSGRTV